MKTYTALMFEFEFGDIESKFGAEHGLVMKFYALENIVEPILNEMKGIALEDVLWIFDNPSNAVNAALKLKAEFAKYNELHSKEKEKIDLIISLSEAS